MDSGAADPTPPFRSRRGGPIVAFSGDDIDTALAVKST